MISGHILLNRVYWRCSTLLVQAMYWSCVKPSVCSWQIWNNREKQNLWSITKVSLEVLSWRVWETLISQTSSTIGYEMATLFVYFFAFFFYWHIIDLQRCVSCRCTAKYTRIYMYIYIYFSFFRFFSLIGYYKIFLAFLC